MSYGVRLAHGCNIGSYFGGIASLGIPPGVCYVGPDEGRWSSWR
ncbi:YeeE/YedE family protein [Saccharopolyspora sp. HNM0986]|nr:YeeE/YedE family protein [Saccharopolyspora sp. HNM0986]